MTGRQPVIGIVGNHHAVPRFWGELAVTGAPEAHVEKVVGAGGRPVVLPGSVAGGLLDVVDALVLTGGGDVDPSRYGGSPGEANEVDPRRDADEIALVHQARAAGVPMLGICRGLQVLVVASGGTLQGGLGMSHVLPETGHQVRTRAGSLVRSLVGDDALVSALHRQVVADPGPCWRPTAWAEDGQIEAAEWAGPDRWAALGVQWHPELDPSGAALYGWLVRAASIGSLCSSG